MYLENLESGENIMVRLESELHFSIQFVCLWYSFKQHVKGGLKMIKSALGLSFFRYMLSISSLLMINSNRSEPHCLKVFH